MHPFKYGTIVGDRYFINRKKELQQMKDELKNGTNIILYAPRRYGKSSLITKVLNNLKKEGVKTVYLDLFQTYSVESFIQLYATKVMESCGFSIKKALKSLKTSIKGIIPAITLDNDGKPILSITYDSKMSKEHSLLDVLDLPKKLKTKNEKWVIVFDEFQEIYRLNGETVEKQFRSVLQFHQDIGYVMMGSKTHMMLNLFADKQRAFYNIGKIQKLDKIPKEEIFAFLEKSFTQGGFTLEKGILEKVLLYTDNIPYYNQYLASQIWQMAKENNHNIDEKTVEASVQGILDNQSDYYFTLMDRLTVYQRQVLHAFLHEKDNIFSKDYSQKYNLSSVSSTQRAMKKLVETGIIEKMANKYIFSDPFFPQYLKLRFYA